MLKADADRFFETFQGIIESVIGEKREQQKWQKKLQNFNAIVQFRLRIDTENYIFCHLIAKGGKYDLKEGPAEKFTLELGATPGDLMNYTNRTYSIMDMIMKKNAFGQKRLQVKKGGRNLGKLLAVAKLLVLD